MYPGVLLEEFVYLSVILESIGEKRKQIATWTNKKLDSIYSGQQELSFLLHLCVILYLPVGPLCSSIRLKTLDSLSENITKMPSISAAFAIQCIQS